MRRYRFQAIFLFLACYAAVLGMVLSIMGKSLTVSSMLHPEPTVILDAGHGGFDGGAEGAGGVVEKDINLSVTLKIRDLLQTCGYQVILTREKDVSTCDDGIDGISAKKTSDILNRFEVIQKHPDAIFLSIHQNKFPQASSAGAQMFYGPKAEQSQILASILQQNFHEMLQPDNAREIKPAENNIYLLYNSPITSVLIECGFLSNSGDLALLTSEEYQNQIAFTVTASLLEYIQQAYYPQIALDEPEGILAER